MRVRAFNERQEDELSLVKFQAWLSGLYVKAAVAGCFDSSVEYPENPVGDEREKTVGEIAEEVGKTEEELNQEMVYATMLVQQANFELGKFYESHKKDNKGEKGE